MDLSEIITISGKKGLFKLVTKTRTGMVVESFEDGRRLPAFVTDRSSTLEDISIFTHEKEVSLKDVFWKIHEKTGGKPGPDPKSPPDTLRDTFEEILPDYDKDRVYPSDIKKVFTWYNILLEKDLITKPEEPEKEEKDPGSEDKKEDNSKGEKKPAAKKPVKATRTNKSAKPGKKEQKPDGVSSKSVKDKGKNTKNK